MADGRWECGAVERQIGAEADGIRAGEVAPRVPEGGAWQRRGTLETPSDDGLALSGEEGPDEKSVWEIRSRHPSAFHCGARGRRCSQPKSGAFGGVGAAGTPCSKITSRSRSAWSGSPSPGK
jgi:hypothetical protein